MSGAHPKRNPEKYVKKELNKLLLTHSDWSLQDRCLKLNTNANGETPAHVISVCPLTGSVTVDGVEVVISSRGCMRKSAQRRLRKILCVDLCGGSGNG